MGSGCVHGSWEGGQDPDEEAVKVCLIRFIADLPLSWLCGFLNLLESGSLIKQSRLVNPAFQYGCSHAQYYG